MDARRHQRTKAIGVAALCVLLLAGTTIAGFWGYKNASAPARCPYGSLAIESRCCADGQTIKGGRCTGTPKSCPPNLSLIKNACVALPKRVTIAGGALRLGPGDWEAQGFVQPRVVKISTPFELDVIEVTYARWEACANAGACTSLSSKNEPGCPVSGVTFVQAASFCEWAGGTLPSEDAWILAAAGPHSNRYPWGNTGAVCRRADWGRLKGPCALQASQPEWAGLFAADRTPHGVMGLAGGVSEWSRSADGPVVLGGSYRSQLATQLRTWRREKRDSNKAYKDVGFRCMY
ncbi:MAG: hypothetical protein CSA75_02065 [Sorangium cellulosum]|nr:MAG: hypothetical protein CSA75_02065 [Sorangium cellulosum]